MLVLSFLIVLFCQLSIVHCNTNTSRRLTNIWVFVIRSYAKDHNSSIIVIFKNLVKLLKSSDLDDLIRLERFDVTRCFCVLFYSFDLEV